MGLLSPGWSWRACGRILAQDPAPEGVGAAHGPDGEKQRVSQEKKDACVTGVEAVRRKVTEWEGRWPLRSTCSNYERKALEHFKQMNNNLVELPQRTLVVVEIDCRSKSKNLCLE